MSQPMPPAPQRAQHAAPQVLTDVGDLSWVVALINWLVDRDILPGWVASLLLFALNMFVPAVRGNPQAVQAMDDLHQAWDGYVQTHPMAQPYTIGGTTHVTRG